MVRAQVDHLVDRPQVQARRRAQPSGTNSPSSSHPRLKHRARCAIFCPCPPCGRQGRPGQGFLAGSNTSEPRGSAPRERDHRGGDHPVPSRTRQLSPPSPRVLQREAAGGQGVALAEGAFLCLRGSAREEMCEGAPHAPRRPAGEVPPAGFSALWVPEGYGEVFFISHICVIGTNSTCRRLFMPLSIDSLVLLHCLAFSLEFSFSRVVGHRFGGFDAAY